MDRISYFSPINSIVPLSDFYKENTFEKSFCFIARYRCVVMGNGRFCLERLRNSGKDVGIREAGLHLDIVLGISFRIFLLP